MYSLKSNVHQFPEMLNDGTAVFINRLQAGQSPEALMIKCSIFSENPELIQKYALTGELLYLQTIGPIIPSYYDEGSIGEKALLEQAICQYQVKNIIVCGHFPSLIMRELVEQSVLPQERLSLVPPTWQNLASSTIELLKSHYNQCSKSELIDIAVKEHVLVQIERLLQYPDIYEKVIAGRVKIHGWVYYQETKDLLHYSFKKGQYISYLPVTPEDLNNIAHIPKRYTC